MKGFRYQTCMAATCIVVTAPKAWLSQTNGAFVAAGKDSSMKGPAKNPVTLQILKSGKMMHTFSGDEIVSQPEINTITVESPQTVVMVDIHKATFEVIAKTMDGSR